MRNLEMMRDICQGDSPMGNSIAEGKTKIIHETTIPGIVLIESKDSITAGDGLKKDVISGKARLATRTTVNCFKLLEKYGVPTHFRGECSENSFLAEKVSMVPLECVARRVATGSFLKRNLNIQEGTHFNELELEFFYKDDPNHDPMVTYSEERDEWNMYNPKLPKEVGHQGTLAKNWLGLSAEDVKTMRRLTAQVFEILETAWAALDIMLVDLKIEFGRDELGNLVVADVIDNDAWRIWPGGNKANMLDKQTYRNLVEKPTDEQLAGIKGNYERVANLTDRFVMS